MPSRLSSLRSLPLRPLARPLAGLLGAALLGCIPYGNTLCWECAEDDEACKKNACSNHTDATSSTSSSTSMTTTEPTTTTTPTTLTPTGPTSTSTTDTSTTADTSTSSTGMICSYDLTCDADETPETCLHDCGACDPDGVCDDALENPYACPEDCPATACEVNGEINALGEQCDDGNDVDDDSCTNACTLNVCGDGHLYAVDDGGTEECDDGNDVAGDGCTSECVIERRLVFVSSATFKGDLGPAIDGLSGLDLGDAQCQKLAEDADKSGTFKAWLSDGANGPASRFGINPAFSGVFELVDGTVVANGWADLIDGELAHAIDVDELGTTGIASTVWTNTKVDGQPSGAKHCQGWTIVGGVDDEGHYGFSGGLGSKWTSNALQVCPSSSCIYCFQVE